jgi:ABC-type siderophore export system fused ATPase/permease subunit
MLRRYTFWLAAAVLFQLITAVVHFISLFIRPVPEDETELQLLTMLASYQKNLGAGFLRTYSDLLTAMSSCFAFLCLLVEPAVMKGVIAINVGIFGAAFVVMAVFTFLPPIILTGLIFVNLLAAYLVVPKIESAV